MEGAGREVKWVNICMYMTDFPCEGITTRSLTVF